MACSHNQKTHRLPQAPETRQNSPSALAEHLTPSFDMSDRARPTADLQRRRRAPVLSNRAGEADNKSDWRLKTED